MIIFSKVLQIPTNALYGQSHLVVIFRICRQLNREYNDCCCRWIDDNYNDNNDADKNNVAVTVTVDVYNGYDNEDIMLIIMMMNIMIVITVVVEYRKWLYLFLGSYGLILTSFPLMRWRWQLGRMRNCRTTMKSKQTI